MIKNLIIVLLCLLFHTTYSQSESGGHWKLYSAELVKLGASSQGESHTVIKDAETEVVFNHKNPSFKRPSASGNYKNLPLGYDMYVKYIWTSLPTTLKPFDNVSTALSVVIEGNSRNAQDAVVNYSSRVYFVDLSKRKRVESYQIPYSSVGDWKNPENSIIKGPKVSWSYNDQSYHRDQRLVEGYVRNNTYGSFTKMGVIVEFTGFGYWLYSYVWSDENLPDSKVESSDKIDIGGSYTVSSFPELEFVQNGNRVIGTYKLKNGRIEGEVVGNRLVGTWSQSNAKGKFVFTFSDDLTSFQGVWGYNEEEPTYVCAGTKKVSIPKRTNNNERTEATRSIAQIAGSYRSSDFPELQIFQEGNKISGTYNLKNGKIEGNIKGNQIVGRWTQSNAQGKFVFNFSDGFSTFDGVWGYDESEPDHACSGVKL